jgi:hypothetical protein
MIKVRRLDTIELALLMQTVAIRALRESFFLSRFGSKSIINPLNKTEIH